MKNYYQNLITDKSFEILKILSFFLSIGIFWVKIEGYGNKISAAEI